MELTTKKLSGQEHETFEFVLNLLNKLNIQIDLIENTRPWGGFFVINELSTEKFIKHFFLELPIENFTELKVSPKILLVKPQKKLSWQYHFRRSEYWKLIQGEAGIIKSSTNTENEMLPMINNQLVQINQGERHRLVGLESWGIVAEIWVHSDTENPSNEEDIVRLSDDFGRN